MTARKFTVSAADASRPLGEIVAERLGIALADARARIAAGAIWVGRERVIDPDRPLAPGQRIAAHEPEPEVAALAILHRDDDILIVDKPPGVASQSTRTGTASAQAWVEAHDAHARLVHRLDRDASGPLLFARHRDASARFQRWLDEGKLARIYRAIVLGHPAATTQVIDRPIGPDPRDRRRQIAGTGRPATTRVTVLALGALDGGSAAAALQLDLVTGRTHQIRVHLAAIGHPVAGDRLYGADPTTPPAVDRLALWMHELAWPGGGYRVTAPPAVGGASRLLAAI